MLVLVLKNLSFGNMAEVLIFTKGGKSIVYCLENVRSPWPLYFASAVTRNEEELIKAFKFLKMQNIRAIPNVYYEHGAESTYKKTLRAFAL